MATDAIHSEHAAAAAALVQNVRSRPNDLIDPYPPAAEMEVLVDMGARGKGDDNHPRIVLEGEELIGYGAVDYSPDMRRAQLVGPVVHPAHRRKGHGALLLNDLLLQARNAKQKIVRGAVGVENGAGQALLKSAGFKPRERHTCLRLGRPEKLPRLPVEGVRLVQVDYDDGDAYHDYCKRLMPRQAKQTRALLKTDEYCIIQAFKGNKRVGCVEIDMRYDDTAVVETIDASTSLLHKGLGNALLAEAIRVAFERQGIEHLDLLMQGADRARIEEMTALGFTAKHELQAFELKL